MSFFYVLVCFDAASGEDVDGDDLDGGLNDDQLESLAFLGSSVLWNHRDCLHSFFSS